jgi:hypothetical protein
MKSFYDFDINSRQERFERNSMYPELASFHIALREELNEEEYHAFYRSEKESLMKTAPMFQKNTNKWIRV